MGLAASQARFLQLTARKSNIEYQGQQINQQRLSLANQSAGLTQKQLDLVVPTPPSSSDDKYNKPSYDYTDPTDDVKKNIVFTFDDDNKITGYTISYSKYATDGTYQKIEIKNTDSNAPYTVVSTLTYDSDANTFGISGATAGGVYINNNPTVDDSTGRVANMIIATASDATTVSSNSSGYLSLTYSTVFDELSYNDDMNQYEYLKATYEYEIEKINAQTDEIQRQDRSLELKMKQLDTEHTAIQDELDAVQKVIQTNIERSYKTFSS